MLVLKIAVVLLVAYWGTVESLTGAVLRIGTACNQVFKSPHAQKGVGVDQEQGHA